VQVSISDAFDMAAVASASVECRCKPKRLG
jgi:hypothetical protein